MGVFLPPESATYKGRLASINWVSFRLTLVGLGTSIVILCKDSVSLSQAGHKLRLTKIHTEFDDEPFTLREMY